MRVICNQIEKEKSVADAVLERLEIIDPTCILAGGAPRDWWLGNTANDLDFYLYYRGDTPSYEKALKGLGLQDVQPLQPQGLNARARQEGLYGTMSGLRSVHEATHRGKKIQLMRMSQPTFCGVVDAFAVSISKVWYKNGTITPTRAARESRDACQIDVAPEYSPQNRYVQKMIQRFPSYTFRLQLPHSLPAGRCVCNF